MASSGRFDPGRADDGSGERDYAVPGDSAFDSADLAQQPDAALQAILREIAPGARRDTPEARAARIESDRRIVAHAAAENFDGPNTKKLLLAAFQYAHPVVSYLIVTGRIFGECVRLGRPVERQPGDELWTDEDRAFLTDSCVDMGIFHLFHEHGLKRGRWDPRRGTALTTYGVNACSLCFKSIYQKWWRGRVLERSFGDLAVDLPPGVQVDRYQPDPAEQAINRVEADRLLRQISEPARTALWLRGIENATQAEAASYVGLTEKALEGRIGRAREKLGLAQIRPPKGKHEAVLNPHPEPGPDAQEG